jgi:hypothetical protein
LHRALHEFWAGVHGPLSHRKPAARAMMSRLYRSATAQSKSLRAAGAFARCTAVRRWDHHARNRQEVYSLRRHEAFRESSMGRQDPSEVGGKRRTALRCHEVEPVGTPSQGVRRWRGYHLRTLPRDASHCRGHASQRRQAMIAGRSTS